MTALPYGLRDVKVTPINSLDGSVGTPVDLPNSRTLTFNETEDYQELRGDDRVVARRGQGPTVEWTLENGGISLEAYTVLNGGTLVVSGLGASQVKTYSKLVTDARPYFKAEGQSYSDSGGDFHAVLFKAKCSSGISGSFTDGEFFVTSASGNADGRDSDGKIYDFVENATPVAIATS